MNGQHKISVFILLILFIFGLSNSTVGNTSVKKDAAPLSEEVKDVKKRQGNDKDDLSSEKQDPNVKPEESKSPLSKVKKNIYVISVSGDVEPGMAAFIKRSLQKASDDPHAIIVAEMDTFGGRVDSALSIVESFLNIPKGKTIAFVSGKAISAGALIALSCNEMAMKHNTTIGDCAPIIYSNDGPKMMGEKFQSPLRAKFRSLAKRNGYPETLAEAMVTAEMVVYRIEKDGKISYMDSHEYNDLKQDEKDKITSKKTIVAEGELLTMDDTEAHQLGFSRMSVSSIDEMLVKMGIENYEIIGIEESWSESFVRLISTITPILLIIGLAAVYMELQAPGFGMPGIIGITCLALVFLNQYLVGLADYTELLIILLGIILLGFELFVTPGFGVAGFSGIGCIAIGMILTLQDFVLPDPDLPWQGELLMKNIIQVLGSFLSSLILALLFLRYVFSRYSTVIKGPYLTATLENSHADTTESRTVRVGDTGAVYTFLRPSGKAKIGDEIFDVITEGEFMEKGALIEVLKIKGNRIIVSRKSI